MKRRSRGSALEGMTLRQYLAAKAMQGLLANGSILLPYQEGWEKGPARMAALALACADALIAEARKAPVPPIEFAGDAEMD